MKYQDSVYKDFGVFFAKAIEISKDKISLYNTLIGNDKIKGSGFMKFLNVVIMILKRIGWFIFTAIVGLIALGAFAFFGGMGTLIATNPVLAAVVATIGGGAIVMIWKNRKYMVDIKKVGDNYKTDFDSIVEKYKTVEHRATEIENLLTKCVKSICIEVYQFNYDEKSE